MDVKIGQEVTIGAGFATAQQINVTDGIQGIDCHNVIKITSGTLKFGIGAVPAGQYGYGTTDRPIFFCKTGQLYVTGAAATDKFVINQCL